MITTLLITTTLLTTNPTPTKEPPKKEVLIERKFIKRDQPRRAIAVGAVDQLIMDGRKAYSHKNFGGAKERYQAALLKLKEVQILNPERTFLDRLTVYQAHYADSADVFSTGKPNRLKTLTEALEFAPHSTLLHKPIFYCKPSITDYRQIYASYLAGIKNFACFYKNPEPAE